MDWILSSNFFLDKSFKHLQTCKLSKYRLTCMLSFMNFIEMLLVLFCNFVCSMFTLWFYSFCEIFIWINTKFPKMTCYEAYREWEKKLNVIWLLYGMSDFRKLGVKISLRLQRGTKCLPPKKKKKKKNNSRYSRFFRFFLWLRIFQFMSNFLWTVIFGICPISRVQRHD